MTRLLIDGLSVQYGKGRQALTAVEHVSLAVGAGETHGLVGESGSGKSSIARGVVGMARASAGRVLVDGEEVSGAERKPSASLRQAVQMVFQNPYASLNPRMTVGTIVEEAIIVHRPSTHAAARRNEAGELLELVGLPSSAIERFPHQFSGGQRQRIAVARAIATGAKVLILDEVTSALDVSIQANILNLLKQLQRERNLSYLFISHDLAVVRYMSDVVSVMYLGRIVETARAEDLFHASKHPYTRALLESLPGSGRSGSRKRDHLIGEIPDPRNPPPGCRFHTRCPVAALDVELMHQCRSVEPSESLQGSRHVICCHAAKEK